MEQAVRYENMINIPSVTGQAVNQPVTQQLEPTLNRTKLP